MKQITCTIAFVLAALANAQWTVVNLHPAGASESLAVSVRDGQQVGDVQIGGGPTHASLWTGTAASWVDLHQPGHVYSHAYGVGGGKQVGEYYDGNVYSRACHWSGTAATWVDLAPAGSLGSAANAATGPQQVGSAFIGGISRAGIWTGTAGSWVDLHPGGSTNSSALGAAVGQQVGYAEVGGGPIRASLWTGTPASWVDLNPAGASTSRATAVAGGQQVGEATFAGVRGAGLWTGTAGSWVNLHPAGATASLAWGADAGQQVGVMLLGGVLHACLWYGTSTSVDLNAFLPIDFSAAQARGIWRNGDLTYIVGYGSNVTTNRTEALMWVSRAVGPASFSMVRGSVFSGNLASLLNTDNNRLVMRPGFVFSVGEPPVQVRVNASAPTASPNGFSFSVESGASFGNAQQKVWLWNYVLGDYELLDTRLATTTDDVVTVTVRTNPSRFIQPGTLAIRALVSYRAVGPAFAYPWSGRIDKVWWTFPG